MAGKKGIVPAAKSCIRSLQSDEVATKKAESLYLLWVERQGIRV
jgi:hypothetical protein